MIESLPANLQSLHVGEESIRLQALDAVLSHESRSLHVITLERAMDALEYFARSGVAKSQEDKAFQLLGARLFNGSAAALKLLFSGYYQASASQVRDVLETAFLVSYIAGQQGLILEWWEADRKQRKAKFSPVAVRTALDKRDGFTEMKRAEQYRLLSTFASHPHPSGFQLLRPSGQTLARIGPFFDAATMDVVLAEMCRSVIPAASSFLRHFEAVGRTDHLMKLSYFEAAGLWLERFTGRTYDASAVNETRAMAMRLPADDATATSQRASRLDAAMDKRARKAAKRRMKAGRP